ncbi:FkbM family methyltransferase [Sphingobium sp. HBC34]|uniref:FkbM family methyltransferase n=1 Tax=Sphingobium cyanobacteriorum TaxID=3063954 RepID=A0ABT8ZJU3_9SPHN|nr:FkbM family methyltransferase [Sphingobium sp. HBC34]MDO7834055.1 FkbM family methyltransferase [Sphingobium sp. HBC34]
MLSSDSTQQSRILGLNDLIRRSREINQTHIRSMGRTVVLDSRTAITRVLGRYKMFVDPSDLAISVHLMFDGFWEMWLTEEMIRLVKPGMVVADVGANLGYFSILMADIVGPAGKVLAYEPNPEMADLMRRSLLVNGLLPQVDIVQSPLTGISGEAVTLYYNREQPGGAFVTTGHRDDHEVGISLFSRRFDDHPDAQRVQFAKIDAEGAEEGIWAGMAMMLAGDSLRTVVMEWCACRYRDPAAFLAAMTAPGFTLSHLDPSSGVTPVSAQAVLADSPYREWLFVLQR